MVMITLVIMNTYQYHQHSPIQPLHRQHPSHPSCPYVDVCHCEEPKIIRLGYELGFQGVKA